MSSLTLLLFLSFLGFGQKQRKTEEKIDPIYKFKVQDINGIEFDFNNLKGKKIMIVNTASKCGFTKQFEALQAVYEKYKDANFIIIGFPTNDFLKQDPGTNKEILEYCTLNYGVTFPMMSKIKVKGIAKNQIYEYLTEKKLNGYKSSKVKWNFQKYLINEEGYLERIYSTSTVPNNQEIINWIEGK